MGLLQNHDDEQKPLFRKWLKANSSNKDFVPPTIIEIRLSSSEEWLIIECDVCTALLNAESKVGKQFWEFAQTLDGSLKNLVLVPARGKLGFDIEPGDQVGTWYQDDMAVTYGTKAGKKSDSSGISKLTLDMLRPTDLPSVENSQKKPGK